MRYCTLVALLCLLIPAASFAQQSQRTFGDMWNRPAGTTQPILGPGHHVVGPTAALLGLLGPGHHMLGPVAALLGLFGPGHHVVGPTAALCGLPAGRVNRQAS